MKSGRNPRLLSGGVSLGTKIESPGRNRMAVPGRIPGSEQSSSSLLGTPWQVR